jgi:hypothetical protein
MYEYVSDSGPGLAHGQGIQSFGGTWYAISPAGMPVSAGAAPAVSSSTSSSNGY